ncbi:MAG: hypothetical protein NWE93_00675 [Candidatus Bathyarchaeota archaeon]|nr:hypothetical protein [Candidatus Bathyarchaeota archaeon]
MSLTLLLFFFIAKSFFSGQRFERGGDFLFINTENAKFIIEKVPEGFGPNWSSNIGIEYKKAWGSIPDATLRAKICELCSFVFGRQLLNIGYTAYDEKNYVIESYARSPWGNIAKSSCKKVDKTPIFMLSIPQGPIPCAEMVIAQLLPEYIKYREVFRLKEALWNLWISNQMPIGPNIPVLASALESIIKGWFTSVRSESQGCFISNSDYQKMIEPEVSAIKAKLEAQLKEKEAKKIISTIVNSNSFGHTERYRSFFQEIKLSLTDVEDEAIRERHKFVHGGAIFDNEDWTLISRRAVAFEKLVCKVILRVLSYSGEFIDKPAMTWGYNENLKNLTSP